MIQLLFLLLISTCAPVETTDHPPKIRQNLPFVDILDRYALKPPHLDFISCTMLDSNQVIIKAEYRVKGEHFRNIEKFLTQNYGMAKLKWTCCGWEFNFKPGYFESDELKDIN